MATPTFVSDVDTAFNSATSPKSTASLSASVGDVLIAVGGIEAWESITNFTFANTGTAATWTEMTAGGSTTSDTFAQIAHATIASALTAETCSLTRTAGNSGYWYGMTVARFSGANMTGAGSAAATVGDTTSPVQVAVTTAFANSAIVYGVFDYAAVDAPSRAHTTVNGYTPTAANGQELAYFRDASHYTACIAYIVDAGAAGSKTVGMTMPGSPDAVVVAIEVPGATAAAAVPLPVINSQHINRASRW